MNPVYSHNAILHVGNPEIVCDEDQTLTGAMVRRTIA
jgi:hypothetical protein